MLRARLPRARARRRSRRPRYLKDGQAVAELSQRGGLAVAVPGEVRGLGEMVRRWGKLPFRRCVEPAQKLAAKGFPVSWRLARQSGRARSQRGAGRTARFIEMFAAKPLHAGEHLAAARAGVDARQAARRRPDAFYKGEIATEIVKAVRGAGGVMTAEDLAGYATDRAHAARDDYRGLRVLSMPPPSSGGVALIETLGILAARYPTGATRRASRGAARPTCTCWPRRSSTRFADRARFLGDTGLRAGRRRAPDRARLPRRAGAADQAGRGAAARRLRHARRRRPRRARTAARRTSR